MERTGFDTADGREDILKRSIFFTLLVSFFINGCDTPNRALPYSLIISENGLGALHGTTPFNEVNTALSGFEFEKLSPISPDQKEIIFLMKRGGDTIAQIVSDPAGKKIAEIRIVSPLIKNTHQQGLGDQLNETASIQCSNEQCYDTREPSVHYRIDRETRIIKEITFSPL